MGELNQTPPSTKQIDSVDNKRPHSSDTRSEDETLHDELHSKIQHGEKVAYEERNDTNGGTLAHPDPITDNMESAPSSGPERQIQNSQDALSPQPSKVHNSPSTPFAPLQQTLSQRPYSAFSKSTKLLLVALGGIAAIFSPISSNIFVPAIPTLADAFNRSESDISQAVTVYLVFQAITPSFFGSMSDSFGRRPLYIATLIVYLGANIGLALMPTTKYWLLLFLRALQSTGGSAVISIGYGCIADVSEPRERGKYAAAFQMGAMAGPAFGPLLGGILTQGLGWRSIFWFLAIADGVVLIPLIFFLPETLRSLVGDGSIPPPALSASPVELYQRRKLAKKMAETGQELEPVQRPPPKPYRPFSTFAILLVPEIFLTFFFASLLYLQFYASLTLFSTALKNSYGLSELKIGLCYLPSGIGSIISSQLNGRQLDYYFHREERRVGGDYRAKPEEFNIEKTRIRCLFPFAVCSCLATVAQGWCLQAKANLGATLVMNFLVGLGSGTIGSVTVYGQDIKSNKGGAVSAALNLVRCIFGAIGVASIQSMYNTLGAGWTFVLLTGLVVIASPLPIVVIKKGRGWRDTRKEKRESKKEKKEAKKEKKKAEAGMTEKQANASDAETGTKSQVVNRTNVDAGVGTKV
ncbi:hypothetical protein AYX14_05816 [Cryptococcus neoformans]|nr:hypothetical protein C362_03877 [Cryptococcus neoformans var. grubii Bt1]OWZ67009.1 hypothetical protein AYX14_05816 [Cryptococcus neoformans var. grubii]OWZ75427.1 hypothetical protein C365_05986 [Cryptococcus neoformans var. grubii Bt85]OXG15317.1 hypothetical protein C366_04455 [Cryptococcus neoformans var. grubii Tu401-1]OXM78011.1 hypothetical protein C364_04438 [Cryptococcus neoformans var. grubii Bt63]